MSIRTIKQTLTLFTIIIIEGYIVLSTELLTIRETIPYIGSGTDTVAIIIAAILMPLAFGYQSGGRYKPRKYFGHFISVRKKLIYNICIAATFLFFGLSYFFLNKFFLFMFSIDITNRIIQTAIFCAIFIVTPTYFLGQTVPLISHFFTKEHLPKITGHILFFSTIGSFLGATLSVLVFMTVLGVHHTLTLNFVLMALLVILLDKKPTSLPVIYISLLALFAMYMNTDYKLRVIYPHMRANNAYNLIQAGPLQNGTREMRINLNRSSSYNDDGQKFSYINLAEKIAIEPILESTPPRDILVIGAGGFTFGHNDTNNNYTYVDIDKELKTISEHHILKEPIGENKHFIAKPARAFLYNDTHKYDVIYLDTYLGATSVPEHLVTQEFFIQIKNHLKENGVLVTNFIVTANFNNEFSQTLDNTFRSVFPYISRTAINDTYNMWGEYPDQELNIVYIYRHKNDYGKPHIYTDNKNAAFYEKSRNN
ncbi:MAG: fused MFS/spermidine synthase [Alphaproteobacteria bacterium]|nr:fused MFS/spermidine synthase [Alphaproteobacteria bacterium]